MTDYAQEQEMEIDALEAILRDEFKGTRSLFSTCSTFGAWRMRQMNQQLCQLGLIFSHTEKYPDEPPLLNVKSIRGIPVEDLKILREKLQQEASENLGMAMVYTLVTSSKEWLSERFGQESSLEIAEAEERAKEDIIVPHGEPVTLDTFLAWRERFEAEMALERAKIMPESALTAPKEKKLTGRQWFESGRASTKGAAPVTEGSDEEDDEDIDFDEDDFEDDEEDMLEHFLAEKSESSAHSSRRP
ncbi:RWD domain-containing protein 1-like isoform X2 [Cucurbita pepo subsp. pepo]|uniref:RWD domain-containing protein 1-like isoform X2 n=2 Tax=Cucurbita pepo subsp. pepo TaxID=3664 RepID=UPI000C9D4998|nr:RWD domain-containing protein 1-like isoform X2 [Cucurbita pepo subsp. pepo]